jgi:hypothetical protein
LTPQKGQWQGSKLNARGHYLLLNRFSIYVNKTFTLIEGILLLADNKEQCCQLFTELLSQSRKKICPPGKKNSFPQLFSLLKEFGLKKTTIFVCVSGTITIFLGHFSRIGEDKKRETIL